MFWARIVGLSFIMAMTTFSSVIAESKVLKAPVSPEFERYLGNIERVRIQGVEEEEFDGRGYVPSPVMIAPSQVQRASKAEAFPSKFDLREEGGVTPVKAQGKRGSCWAFAAMGTIESNIQHNSGLDYDFSEMNLINNSGFDFIESGNAFMSMAYFSRGDGPIEEKDDPYDETRYYSPSKIDTEVAITGMVMIPSGMESVKKAIMKHGGLESGMSCEGEFYNDNTNSYYCNDGLASLNHGIMIVGWDDDYSASKFGYEPEGDGAWICKNSWGEEWGEDGFFYISYYDSVFLKNREPYEQFNGECNTDVVSYEVGMDENYDRIYQHDTLGCTWNCGYNSEDAFFANVFECEREAQIVESVGFYTLGYDSEYDVYIVKDYDGEADFENEREFFASGTIESAGYSVVRLDKPFSVSKGQKFAVAVKVSTPGQTCPVAIEHAWDNYSSAAQAFEGESFISKDGNDWEDASKDGGFNVCLKAYASDAQPVDDGSAAEFERGIELYNEEDYEGALELFESAIGKNPTVGEYYRYKGRCFEELSEMGSAIEAFDEGIELLDESHEELSIAKGDALQSIGSYDKALECYEDALETRKSELALHGKAVCLSELERYEEAIEAYIELSNVSFVPYPYVIELVEYCFEAGDYEACIKACEAAEELDTTSLKAPVFEARVYFKKEDHVSLIFCVEEMQDIYDRHWEGAGNEEVEEIMCEAMVMKARALLKTSQCFSAVEALEESVVHGSCEMADEVMNKIKAKLSSYDVIEFDFQEIESDHVFTIEFTGKVDFESIGSNIFVLDSDGRIVDTSAYIYGAWKEIRVSPLEDYESGDYVLYVEPSIMSTRGESLTNGVRVGFTVLE